MAAPDGGPGGCFAPGAGVGVTPAAGGVPGAPGGGPVRGVGVAAPGGGGVGVA